MKILDCRGAKILQENGILRDSLSLKYLKIEILGIQTIWRLNCFKIKLAIYIKNLLCDNIVNYYIK